MTLLEVFKECYPMASLEACDELLWLTPYPASSIETVIARIRELRAQYGPKIGDAITGEHAEIDRQWRETRTS